MIVRRRAETAPFHRRLDLGTARGEGVDDLARNPRYLEASIGMGLLYGVAEPGHLARQLTAVERADQHLRAVELFVRHGAPLAIGALYHVGDHRMGVELGIEIPGGLMGEGGDHRLLVPGADHPPGLRIFHPGLYGALFHPGERPLHRPAVGLGDARIAAGQRRQRHRLRGRKGKVAPGPVDDLPVLAGTAQLRPAGHPALKDRRERDRVYRTLEPEGLRTLAGPGAGFAVFEVVLRVIPVALVITDALRRRGDGADRGDHQ